jgi:hypothetical protein
MKNPPRNRLVATEWPLIDSNSFTLDVIREMPIIPRYPMIRQIILEIKARMNHRASE